MSQGSRHLIAGAVLLGCVQALTACARPASVSAFAEQTIDYLDVFQTKRNTPHTLVHKKRIDIVTLSPEQKGRLGTVVVRAFPDNWTIRLLPTKAGRDQKGHLAICGMVTATAHANASARPYLFIAEAALLRNGELGPFRLVSISGSGTEQLQIYSYCREAGLI